MTEHFFQKLWHLIGAAFSLEPDIYIPLAKSSHSETIVLLIVLAAGLSQEIGQSFILFINRIKPVRFVLYLGFAAVLFAFSYVFWTWSIWFVGHFIFRSELQLVSVMRLVALSYAPLLFGFLVGLPYFGIPISVVLSIWSLLILVAGLQNLGSLTTWKAFTCAGLGWVVLQVLQRIAGRPLIETGRWLENLFAGTNLTTDRQSLAEVVQAGNPQATQFVELDWVNAASFQLRSRPTSPILKFLTIALITFFIIGLILTSQGWLTVWFGALSRTARLTVNLVAISLIALLISILLTPLEALFWWAGWKKPGPLNPGVTVGTPLSDTEIARYVIYLDGINQGAYACLPEVDCFLGEVATTLPPNVLVIKGIMPYSVANRPLSQDHPFSFLWRIVESFTQKNPSNPIGFIINLRNVFAVAVSADWRYGPLQNQGLAQVLLDSLVYHGYQPGSQTPITLIGNSGGRSDGDGCSDLSETSNRQ